jgi:hypothetical protein
MIATALPLATTAAETAALVAALIAAVLVVAVLVVLVSIMATLRDLRATTDELRRSTVPLIRDVREVVTQANSELERVDEVLVTAETFSSTVDSASKLAYLAFANPLIKVVALTSGTGRAVRRLRGRKMAA